MSKRTFVVLAEDDPEIFDSLCESIENHGFEIESTAEDVGMLVGSIEVGQVDEIRHLRGVASVTEEMTAHIPSPDSDGPF